MNQSELIEKVAQTTELNQATAGQAVKAVVNAVLDALLAGEAVRVSGLGVFNVAARPAREERNPRTGESIEIAASKAVRFRAGKAVKDALNPPTPKAAPPEEVCTTKEIRGAEVNVLALCGRAGTAASALAVVRGASENRRSVLTTAVTSLIHRSERIAAAGPRARL